MATFKTIEDIEVWQLSRELSRQIWKLTKSGEFFRDEHLRKQILRSSTSTMDNIAEGFGRGGNIEFINFLGIARGSNEEVCSQIYTAFDRGYVNSNVFNELRIRSNIISEKITALINYLKRSENKGQKYKHRNKS